MANSFSDPLLMNDTLALRDDAFYYLVKEHCGDSVLEVIQAQDISSIDSLLAVGNIFTFLELDSDTLIPLRKKVGFMLNDGRFIVKKGISHKVDMFLKYIRDLNQQQTPFNNVPTSSSDLIIPDFLLQKFPFLRTMISYSALFVNHNADLTFFNEMMNNIMTNLVLNERGYRYHTNIRQFALSLYILGGCTAYEFVRMNIPALLPSVRMLQVSLAATANRLSEGEFRYNSMQDYFTSNKSAFGFCAEDCTAVVQKVTYDAMINTFIGFSLPLDNHGFPVINSYSTNSLTQLEEWCLEVNKAKQINIHVVQPISSSLHHPSSYLLGAYGTDNQFTSKDVLCRWRSIFEQSKAQGIRILGFSTDCDGRYLKVMRLSTGFFAKHLFQHHPDLFRIDVPPTWPWFLMNNQQLFVCMQDPIHLCTKLRNRLLSTATQLLLGNQLICIDTLLQLVATSPKLNHGLVKSDICPKDRQNYRSCTKISSDNVIAELGKLPNSLGMSIYLQVSSLRTL